MHRLFRSAAMVSLALLACATSGSSERSATEGWPAKRPIPYELEALRSAEHLISGLQAKTAAAQLGNEESRGLYERAKEELLASVELSPSYGALVALGEVHLALGQCGEAERACSRALFFSGNSDAAARCARRAIGIVDEPVLAATRSLFIAPVDCGSNREAP